LGALAGISVCAGCDRAEFPGIPRTSWAAGDSVVEPGVGRGRCGLWRNRRATGLWAISSLRRQNLRLHFWHSGAAGLRPSGVRHVPCARSPGIIRRSASRTESARFYAERCEWQQSVTTATAGIGANRGSNRTRGHSRQLNYRRQSPGAESRSADLLSRILVTLLQPRVTRRGEKPERV
jgi:hypothetical protein